SHSRDARLRSLAREGRLLAREKIDRRADAERRVRRDAVAVTVDPRLLLRRAETYQEQLGVRSLDAREDGFVFRVVLLEAEGRTIGSDGTNAWEPFFGAPRRSFRHAG